jgi:hypothetical protein
MRGEDTDRPRTDRGTNQPPDPTSRRVGAFCELHGGWPVEVDAAQVLMRHCPKVADLFSSSTVAFPGEDATSRRLDRAFSKTPGGNLGSIRCLRPTLRSPGARFVELPE